MNKEPKKLYIKTYGCQMNVYDSHKMADMLSPLGYEVADDYEAADMVILNTCHIREKAAEKVYSELGRIRKEKDKKKDMKITVAGCVGQAEGDQIKKRAPFVDFVVGPQSFQNLPRMLVETDDKLALDFAPEEKFDSLPEESKPQGTSAFLTIQEGCDKFCTFCVVPFTRGAEYSRPFEEVVEEAKKLVAQGAVDINLLGQNVNAYHGKKQGGATANLAELALEISKIDGVERIRYTTSHPRDMDDELIAAHGEIAELMPFLHLPVQSGSNKILDDMNRKHSREFYLDIIKRLRAARPDMAFSSDFIVGFPGETDEDFEDTYRLIEEVFYAQCYSFKYSPRPGTKGWMMDDDFVPEEVKSERLARLQNLINAQQMEFNSAMIGKTTQVLLDRKGRYDNQLIGRTPYMQAVHLTTELENFGNIVEAKVLDVHTNSLKAEIISSDSPNQSNKQNIAA